MIAYIDSSVVLRVILDQPGRLVEWKRIERGVASALIEVECLRTLDRLRLLSQRSTDAIVAKREDLFRVIAALEIVDVSRAVLHRAALPMPTPVGSLDAIHLATADLWREANGTELRVATHDRELSQAARASGFQVIGISELGAGR